MKAHRTDSLSLFFGLAFLMISGGYLATAYIDLDLPSVGWFLAAGLIFLGVVGAITALVPSKQPETQPETQPAPLVEPPAVEETEERAEERAEEPEEEPEEERQEDRQEQREEDTGAERAR
jgi:outer membrane biosynthesis protein TonB